jgi:hypothetical protein
MIRKIRFFKEKSNKWFLDLEGSEEKIEMTKGMEDLLVFLSGGDDFSTFSWETKNSQEQLRCFY